MDNAAPYLSPSVGVLAAHDDDIGRQAQIAQGAMKANRLLSLVSDLRLHDQEVDIAVRSRISTSVGAEQNDLGVRSSRSQAAPGLSNQGLVNYVHDPGIVVPAPITRQIEQASS